MGEVIGLGALAVAALGYMDQHRERRVEDADRAAAAARRPAAKPSLVLTAEPVEEGARLLLRPMRPGQAIQSQRYLFPHLVLDHAMEVAAAQPQVQAGWVRDGLLREAEAAAKFEHRKTQGFGRLPVGIVTTFVEDGELRTDRSIYEVGYRLDPGGLFGKPRLVLQGVALVGRDAAGGLQQAVEARWRAAPKLL